VYVTRQDLLKKYPGIGLEYLLKDVPENVQIRDFSPAAMKWLTDYLASSGSDETKLATMKDHLAWSTVSKFLDDSNPRFFKKWFDFRHKHLGGPAKRSPRKERCTDFVMDRFGRELDAEMIDVVFPNFPSEKIIGLGEKIRSAIIARMEQSDWLSPETRKEGIEKVKVMKLQLVKPANDEEWDFNPPGTYQKDKPLSNRFMVNTKRREKMIQRISKPRNPNIWGMGPLTVNAYYNPTSNKFVMPIGILQYPFFDVNAPDEINLGAVGVVLGHEIGHGIDDKGSRYDKDGKLRQWMKDDEVKTFMSRGDRLVEQFNAIAHNGKLTLGENMADLSGLTFAWDAAFPAGFGKRELKRGFYIQYARLWCETIRPKFREMRLKTDPHATGEARVNEQMKHQTGFAEQFSCKAGNKLWLDPDKRVTIW
jgi:putative endopeptidase